MGGERPIRRTAGIAAAMAAVLSTIAVAPAAPASPAGVHSLSPPPEAVIAAGAAMVEAWLTADGGIRSAGLTIDGVPVHDAVLGPQDPARGTPLRATVSLGAGLHVAEVTFEDGSGATVRRAWRVVATDTTWERLAGEDRYATAVQIARATFPGAASASAVVLARGDEFADGLAGAPLAAAVDGPLLLTVRDGLPAVVADELRRVARAGTTVHLLGGREAIADDVEHQVRAMGYVVARHAGADRFATAAAIAQRMPPGSTAFVVSGTTFPDALAASVPAARDGTPILLTATDHVPTQTAAALRDRGTEHVTIVGGPTVVSEEVARDLERLVGSVERIAGGDRHATARLVAERFFPDASGIALAAGGGYADALAGAPYLGRGGTPLLFSGIHDLRPDTVDAIRTVAPASMTVLGGTGVVSDAAAGDALAATADATGAPHLTVTAPGPAARVTWLDHVALGADADLAAGVRPYVSISGVEVPTTVTRPDARTVAIALPSPLDLPYDTWHDVTVHVALEDADGRVARRSLTFELNVPDPYLGDAGPVPLYLPSRDVQLIGFHQSNHDGARQIEPRGTSTPMVTLESRGRGTGSRTAADIVANPDLPVFAPATGRVIRAGTYRLYCDHTDHYLVIEPDAAPGWEVKMLHFEGLAVARGDRVTAGATRVGSRPRVLPFSSQVDEASDDRDWPHVHVEVVDPSIPDRPGSGC